MRSTVDLTEHGRIELTKAELNDIGYAIAGNPHLVNNGVRTDFGYIGDVGALPPDLDALMSNPGGYLTWNGPYIQNRFESITSDYKQDAWGVDYTFSNENVISTGSGSSIVYKIGQSVNDFLNNSVSGNIFDKNGTPPGDILNDSITVILSYPNGSGAVSSISTIPDKGGYFSFSSIPIGNHDIKIIYQPSSDTLSRFVSVTPKSDIYQDYYFQSEDW